MYDLNSTKLPLLTVLTVDSRASREHEARVGRQLLKRPLGSVADHSSKHLSLAPQRAPVPQGNGLPRSALGADAVRCGKGGREVFARLVANHFACSTQLY